MSQPNRDPSGEYVEGEVHPNTKPYATFETKPRTYTASGWDSGSGYEHWRSTEHRPHTARQGKEDVYVSHHRLLAVVACYDLDTPIEVVLEDLRDRDVHHNAPETNDDAGFPFDNRPSVLEVINHKTHSERTQAQMRAWGEDAKQRAHEPATHGDDGVCPGCGREDVDVDATSPGFDGQRCIECAMEECDGEPIDLGGGV
ncbi:hypothetical protein [Halobacterium hubeiense]|uniref:hypothetical protein n=1 Tax=Halobacterium hubeiense TaxID=1407499 RepID=UPI00211AF454|nr:hypothetical protein [Halobacterium hubeiense]